jgi:hypothetical protein
VSLLRGRRFVPAGAAHGGHTHCTPCSVSEGFVHSICQFVLCAVINAVQTAGWLRMCIVAGCPRVPHLPCALAVSCFCTSMQPIGMLSAWNCCCNEVASFQDLRVLLLLYAFQLSFSLANSQTHW